MLPPYLFRLQGNNQLTFTQGTSISKAKTFFFRATVTLNPASMGLARSILALILTFLPVTATMGYGSMLILMFWKYCDVAGLQISKGTFDLNSGNCCFDAVVLPPTLNCRKTARLSGWKFTVSILKYYHFLISNFKKK